jgi:phosphatidylethanolamine-binding protein (PEBP) family uncharacterized protein
MVFRSAENAKLRVNRQRSGHADHVCSLGCFQPAANNNAIPEGIRNQQQLPHRYNFTIYALDSMMQVPSGANAKELRKAMSGHGAQEGTTDFDAVGYGGPCPPTGVLAEGNLMGHFHR